MAYRRHIEFEKQLKTPPRKDQKIGIRSCIQYFSTNTDVHRCAKVRTKAGFDRVPKDHSTLLTSSPKDEKSKLQTRKENSTKHTPPFTFCRWFVMMYFSEPLRSQSKMCGTETSESSQHFGDILPPHYHASSIPFATTTIIVVDTNTSQKNSE
jgi:hypothetical protein